MDLELFLRLDEGDVEGNIGADGILLHDTQ